MNWPALLWALAGLALPGPATALFEDQAFKLDWRTRQVGVPFAASFIESGSKVPIGAMVATESNVVAVLNANTGGIKWRHQLSQNPDQVLVDFGVSPSGKRASTLMVTTEKEMTVQTWNPSNGLLAAETSVTLQQDSKKPDWAFLLGNEVAAVYKSQGMNSLSLKVEAYCSKTGTFLRKNSFTLPVSAMQAEPMCVKTAVSVFACADLEQGMLYYFRLPAEPTDGLKAVPLDSLGVKLSGADVLKASVTPVPKSDALSIVTDSKAFVLNFNRGKFTSAKAIVPTDKTSNLVLTGCSSPSSGEGDTDEDGSSDEANMLSVQSDATSTTLTIMALDGKGQPLTSKKAVKVKVEGHRGKVVAATASCGSGRGGRNQPYDRLMLHFQDGSISSVSDNGDVFWNRDEGLASIQDVQMIDTGEHVIFDDSVIGESAHSTSGEALYSSDGKGKGSGGVMGQLFKRLRHHAAQLHSYITHLVAAKKDLGSLLAAGLGQSGSRRPDLFGIRKMVVTVTARGKVYGIDSRTGRVMWSFLLESPSGVVTSVEKAQLFLQRASHHFGLDPLSALVFQLPSSSTGGGGSVHVQTFNPLNGKRVGGPQSDLGTTYTKAFLLHHSNPQMIRPLVVLGPGGSISAVVPDDSLGYLKSLSGKLFVTAVEEPAGSEPEKLVGHRMVVNDEKVPKLEPMWSVLSPGARVVTLAGKPSDQVVHSQGRVMADRSVLFKYVNPNLGFLLAEGKDASSKTFINVYLIDLVTGRIVFSVTHKRVTGPYHVVHSENWAVYTYFNEKSRRAELASLELFEGKTQNNATVFSSLHSNISPLVERQSFILGPSHVTALSETLTEKGITTKHLLMATSTGAIYDIPKHLLDPRRPNINTPADQREPGLPPYLPELQMPPEAILNYNQTVLSVKGITTAATELESTSVVFVHGLDLYCTSMTPSKGFDLLNDDFDYYVISSVLCALIAAAVLTKKMSQRKNLNQAWR